MSKPEPPKFGKRPVQEWLERAEEGVIALPSFQRSYVWKSRQSIADYLTAVFMNRPTGVFLVLKANGSPKFRSRTLKGIRGNWQQEPEELLLDGQQRLTSLWQVFNGTAPVRYYVKVQSLENRDVSVRDIVFWADGSATGKAMRRPADAYAADLVPVDILLNRVTKEAEGGEIWEWSITARKDDPRAARNLERAIVALREQVLLRRDLHYCELSAQTDKHTAIDIFVQSNKSSVKVNEFDIAVALASGKGDENLRERISEFHQQSEVTRHYCNVGEDDDDDEGVIAPLGEWLLFGACLTLRPTGVAPKKQRFEEVVGNLFKLDKDEANDRLDKLLENIERGLNTVADHGAPTRDTLPALPPLHVVASLQEVLTSVTQANRVGICNKLVSAYLWRAFFTDRYEAKANDRLFEDYKALRRWIVQIGKTGTFSHGDAPPIFSDEEYPLPTAETFGIDKPIPWIRGTPRLGRAIAALTLSQRPSEWLTHYTLDARKVRELTGAGNLDRHHVFSRNILTGKVPKPAINHGLNGVILSKQGNQSLSNKDPADYMTWILGEQKGLKEEELRQRVHSHLVPYDIIAGEGSVEKRYEAFIEARAKLVAEKIKELSELPWA